MDYMGLDMMLLLLKRDTVSEELKCAAAAGSLHLVCSPKVGAHQQLRKGSPQQAAAVPLDPCPSSRTRLTACAGRLHHICSS